MAVEVTEPKETQTEETKEVRESDDQLLDRVDEAGKPSESSSEKESTDTETKETKDAGADQQEKGKSEESKEEVKEDSKDPRDIAFRKGYNEAKDKFGKPTEGTPSQEQVELFNKTISSPEYVQTSMKAAGYTQEAIDGALREKGFEVPEKQTDDLKLVTEKLGLDSATLDESAKATINDISRIANVLIENRLGKAFDSKLSPIQERLDKSDNATAGQQMFNQMEKIIKDGNILDFKSDVEPVLHKFMNENPKASQAEALQHFNELKYSLSIERLQHGKKKKTRDESKDNLRTSKEGSTNLGMPKLGDKNLSNDDILDGLGYKD